MTIKKETTIHVPYGKYHAELSKIESKKSKRGTLYISMIYKITKGAYTGIIHTVSYAIWANPIIFGIFWGDLYLMELPISDFNILDSTPETMNQLLKKLNSIKKRPSIILKITENIYQPQFPRTELGKIL